MKVNPKGDLYLRHIDRTAVKRGSPLTPDVQGDSIAISTTARLMQAALEMQEPYAADKVENLKAALEQGRYEVSVERLASRLAGDVLAARGRTE